MIGGMDEKEIHLAAHEVFGVLIRDAERELVRLRDHLARLRHLRNCAYGALTGFQRENAARRRRS